MAARQFCGLARQGRHVVRAESTSVHSIDALGVIAYRRKKFTGTSTYAVVEPQGYI